MKQGRATGICLRMSGKKRSSRTLQITDRCSLPNQNSNREGCEDRKETPNQNAKKAPDPGRVISVPAFQFAILICASFFTSLAS
jgi:hypothetical protein